MKIIDLTIKNDAKILEEHRLMAEWRKILNGKSPLAQSQREVIVLNKVIAGVVGATMPQAISHLYNNFFVGSGSKVNKTADAAHE